MAATAVISWQGGLIRCSLPLTLFPSAAETYNKGHSDGLSAYLFEGGSLKGRANRQRKAWALGPNPVVRQAALGQTVLTLTWPRAVGERDNVEEGCNCGKIPSPRAG